MSRIKPVAVEEAKGEVKEIYQTLQKKLGKVLNIFQNMGNSPAALKAFLAMSEAAEHTSLSPKLREEIALIVGERNNCQYCLAAHSVIAKGKGLNDQEILQARAGTASNPKDQAILDFAKQIVEQKGHVSNQEVAALKGIGVSDSELVEIVLVVMVNMFTNYFNIITDTAIDFPLAPKL